jgi:hypothetical protein
MTTSSMEHGVELVVAVDLGQQALEGIVNVIVH